MGNSTIVLLNNLKTNNQMILKFTKILLITRRISDFSPQWQRSVHTTT